MVSMKTVIINTTVRIIVTEMQTVPQHRLVHTGSRGGGEKLVGRTDLIVPTEGLLLWCIDKLWTSVGDWGFKRLSYIW